MAATARAAAYAPPPASGRASEKLVTKYSKDWDRLRNQKSRASGGIEAKTLLNLLFFYGEHHSEQEREGIKSRRPMSGDDQKLYLVFNLLRRAVNRRMGRLWSIDYSFRATPSTTDPAAFDQADVVSDLIRALNYKLDEAQQHWNRLFWLLLSGTVIEHVPWIEETGNEVMPVIDPETNELLWEDQLLKKVITQGARDRFVQMGMPQERFKPAEQVQMVGEVGSELYCPLNFFIDASVRNISDLSGDQACYFAQIKTEGWLRDTFGNAATKKLKRRADLNIVKTRLMDGGVAASSLALRDLIPAVQGTLDPDDPDMAIVLTRYSPRSPSTPSGSRCIFSPDGDIYDETDLETLNYEGIPARDLHWSPNATTFWTQDFVTDLIAPQKFLNKRVSQLGEAANSQIYELLLLGGALTSKDIPTDMPGVIPDGITDEGVPLVQPMQRGQLPGWFPETIKLVVEFIDAIGGADLLSQRKFPGQLRGPLAIPMLQEILDSEDGPVYTHLGRALADVHQMRVNRVKAYYPAVRTMHYTGADSRDEVLVFHTSKVLRAGWDYTITVDPGSLLPELSSLREARVRERLESPLAALYINPRTGQLDISKVATDLKYGDRQREARGAQGRKLARQLIAHLWKGETLDPALPMAFWPHDEMMDELEAAMLTTEWLSASMPVKQGFLQLYEKHRQILGQQQQAAQQMMQSQMMHAAVAQATQQTAAKVASIAAEEAMLQVQSQQSAAAPAASPTDAIAQMIQSQQQQQNVRPFPARRRA